MFPISSRIRRARAVAAITQSELARRLGVQRSAVTQWERSNGTSPTVNHLVQIACETEVSFEWLATGRGESHPGAGVLDCALLVQDYARDDLETRALVGLRRITSQRREAVVKIIELFSLRNNGVGGN